MGEVVIFIQNPDDCARIQAVLFERFIFATIPECEDLWDRVSQDVAAQWLSLPYDDEALYEKVKPFLGPIEGWNA